MCNVKEGNERTSAILDKKSDLLAGALRPLPRPPASREIADIKFDVGATRKGVCMFLACLKES